MSDGPMTLSVAGTGGRPSHGSWRVGNARCLRRRRSGQRPDHRLSAEFHKATKSPFGTDDEIGMLNLIDAHRARRS